jgi:UDP-N-acetylmuramyl pentapeptide synthase
MPADRIVLTPDRAGATAWLAGACRPGDTILVKASRGAGLDLLVDELVRLFGPAADAPEARA